MNKSLTEIANFHGTDKGTTGPGIKWRANNYTDIYEAYLETLRLSAKTVLEIGLGVTGPKWDAQIVHGRNKTGGASIKMWYDYFPNARIYGIDINPAGHLHNDRIQTFEVDQGNVNDLKTFTDATNDVDFDIIIDDGSHKPDHQQITLNFFFKKLKSGGLYFVEDLMSNGLGDFANDRHACDKVKNTRSVLKSLRESGKFAEPNLLSDHDYLKEHIASINFHTPEIYCNLKFNLSLTRPLRKIIGYQFDTERLCVIRKR